MSPLAPLTCPECAAAVPLLDAEQQQCPFCNTHTPTPPDYVQAIALRRAAAAARKATEPTWARLAAGSSPWWRVLGGAWMALVPPVLTGVGLGVRPTLPSAAVLALFTLPSLFPGGVLFVWGATADLSRQRIAGGLAAHPPSGERACPGCRECGAPLAVEPDALSATCLYCGTDSLVHAPDLTSLRGQRSRAHSSLREATSALRTRLWLVRLGLLGLVVFLAGLSAALWFAQQRLQ